MRKIKTLFCKDEKNLAKVVDSVNPDCLWVYTEEDVKPTRKYDGSVCCIIDGELYKRYDAKMKNGKYKKPIPEGAIPCQVPDKITGHHPHWVKCKRDNPADKYFFEGFDNLEDKKDGTYELCGPKVQGNPEHFDKHVLIRHGEDVLSISDFSFESLREFLEKEDIEGIVFHGEDGKMCKIKKTNFGIKRNG